MVVVGHIPDTPEIVPSDVLAVRGIRSSRVLAAHTCVVDKRMHDDEGRVVQLDASGALVAFLRACASREQDACSDVRQPAS